MKVEYPTRCEIIDVTGLNHPNFPNYRMNTPEKSKPYIGEHGLAERVDGDVRITLDNGNILYGYECWWKPINVYRY